MDNPANIPTPRPTIQVLERTNQLLDLMARHNQPCSLKLLAEESGLHISTCHRILNDLVLTRIVHRPMSGHYQLGMRLLELGNLVKARLNVRAIALPVMRRLQQQTGQTINLAIRQNDEIVYVERSYSERSGMQVIRAIGGHAPLHLTSTGKLFLSTYDKATVLAYAKRTQLKGNTPNSIQSLEQLHQEIERVRQNQSARDNEELELGVACMAAPIYDDAHQIIAGLSISAPAHHMQETWLTPLREASREISQSMGDKT